ncbi:MAG TPA: hypothetical protein VH482_29210 [Thermomicrobiales bacterium]|jgi:hypothetical protein
MAVSWPPNGVAGAWQPTGRRSAAWTLVVLIDGGNGGYVAVRSTAEIAEDGNTLAAPYSFTVVAPDGTVITSGMGNSTGRRLQIEPIEAVGTPLPGMPTWAPAPPATPTA